MTDTFARDRGMRRISDLTRGLVVASVAGAGLISLVAAKTFAGASSSPSQANSAQVSSSPTGSSFDSGGSSAGSGSTSFSGSASAPQPTFSSPQVVSGGS
jgi:hypothetical protein